MSLYGIPQPDFENDASVADGDEIGMEIVDDETLQTWTPGKRITYHLLMEHHYPGHKEGLPAFYDLMKNLGTLIEDEHSVTRKDTVRMLAVIVKENKPHLIKYILNNPLIPGSKATDPGPRSCLKMGIRCGSLQVAEYLISEKVPLISSHKSDEEDVRTFQDIRSLIFNILQCAHINGDGGNHGEFIADKFWTYLATSIYALYHSEKSNPKSSKSENTGNDENEENDEKTSETVSTEEVTEPDSPKSPASPNGKDDDMFLNYDGSDTLTVIAAKFMITNPLIISSIYKMIHSILTGRRYIRKLKPILHFAVEHYMKLDDTISLNQLHDDCKNDEMFDSSSLKPFNIKYLHALKQEYGKTKGKRVVKWFWSEYILIKLVNDYLGIEPEKLSTAKRMEQYGKVNVQFKPDQEREDILYCIRYIVSNGGANHLEDVISPMLQGYRTQFGPQSDADGVKAIDDVCEAVDFGETIWRLKGMNNDEKAELFANVCNKEIELPLDLILCIVSFVVL